MKSVKVMLSGVGIEILPSIPASKAFPVMRRLLPISALSHGAVGCGNAQLMHGS